MGRPKKFSRESALDKALPVFWKSGFAGATLADLEEATGVNKSGLYAEFESKEGLFVACLRYYLELRARDGVLTEQPLGWGNIERFLQEAPSCMANQRGCFFVNSMREVETLPQGALDVIKDAVIKFKRLVQANLAAEKPRRDVKALGEVIWSFFAGLCIDANMTSDARRERRKIRDFVEMLRAV